MLHSTPVPPGYETIIERRGRILTALYSMSYGRKSSIFKTKYSYKTYKIVDLYIDLARRQSYDVT